MVRQRVAAMDPKSLLVIAAVVIGVLILLRRVFPRVPGLSSIAALAG